MATIILNPDPASTYGASDEYKAAWFAAFGFPAAPVSPGGYSTPYNYGAVVTTAQNRWRSEFNVWPNANWTESKTGTGMSSSASGGVLSLVSGTTAGDTLSITGVAPGRMVTVPSRVAFGIKLSQKIANFELYVELVALNDDGSPDETVVVAWKFAGTDTATVTNARYEARNGVGTAGRVQSGNVTVPTLTTDLIAEIQIEADEVWLHMRAMDSSASRTNSYTSQKTAPDPSRRYIPRIRLVNGNTTPATGVVTPAAPATSTTVSVYYVTGSDYTDLMAEISGGSGDSVTGRGVPVVVSNTAPVTGTVTANLVANGVGNAGSTTLLGANATFTGTSMDSGTGLAPLYQTARVVVLHLAGLTPGHLILEESPDNTTFTETLRIPIPSDGVPHTFDLPVGSQRSWRIKFLNGAVAQTAFQIRFSALRLNAPSLLTDSRTLLFPLSTTVLAAGATFTSPTLDLGPNHPWSVLRTLAYSDQAGTLAIDVSRDNVSWRQVSANVAVPAGSAVAVEQSITYRYIRARYVNGATLQGAFALDAALVSV